MRSLLIALLVVSACSGVVALAPSKQRWIYLYRQPKAMCAHYLLTSRILMDVRAELI